MLLDDELLALQYLKLCCEELPNLEITKVFNQVEQFLEQYERLDADFCIIDIEMPGMNGLDLAKKIAPLPVIFTTAYKEFAFEAFELEAVDYIPKPVNKERLLKAIEKIRSNKRLNKKHTDSIQFNTDKGKAVLSVEQIVYIKSSEIDPRDKLLSLEDGSSMTVKNLSFEKIQQLLPESKFCRVNKKELLALKAVKFFSADEITTSIQMKNNEFLKIALGSSYRNDFIQKIKL